MVEGKKRIKSFEDLVVWQEAHKLAVIIYEVTKNFPVDERFSLTSQYRRAAYSVSTNIAEGFGRRTNNDKLHFYTIAYGSTLEVKNFTLLSGSLGYMKDQKQIELVLAQIVSCRKLLNAFVKAHK
jgi:four helix bundle protein